MIRLRLTIERAFKYRWLGLVVLLLVLVLLALVVVHSFADSAELTAEFACVFVALLVVVLLVAPALSRGLSQLVHSRGPPRTPGCAPVVGRPEHSTLTAPLRL